MNLKLPTLQVNPELDQLCDEIYDLHRSVWGFKVSWLELVEMTKSELIAFRDRLKEESNSYF